MGFFGNLFGGSGSSGSKSAKNSSKGKGKGKGTAALAALDSIFNAAGAFMGVKQAQIEGQNKKYDVLQSIADSNNAKTQAELQALAEKEKTKRAEKYAIMLIVIVILAMAGVLLYNKTKSKK